MVLARARSGLSDRLCAQCRVQPSGASGLALAGQEMGPDQRRELSARQVTQLAMGVARKTGRPASVDCRACPARSDSVRADRRRTPWRARHSSRHPPVAAGRCDEAGAEMKPTIEIALLW